MVHTLCTLLTALFALQATAPARSATRSDELMALELLHGVVVECARIEDDQTRLECFDGVARLVDDADNRIRQQRTIALIRDLGSSLLTWLEGELGSRKAEERGPLPTWLDGVDAHELAKHLVPTYISAVPAIDAWGHRLEIAVRTEGKLQILLIRSPGSDGSFSADEYEMGGFPPEQAEQDIVWTEGYFIRYPEAQ